MIKNNSPANLHEDIKNSLISMDKNKSPDMIEAMFCFDGNLKLFSGHFPGMPLVPGIVQIEMVRFLAALRANKEIAILKVRKKTKFIIPVKPGDMIKTVLIFKNRNSSVVKAQFSVGEETVSSINLELEK